MGRYANLLQAPRVQKFVQKVGTITYASGATTPLNISQTDYTTRLKIVANGLTVTNGGTAPVIAGYGAFGPLNMVQVSVNGARHPYALPGFHADIYNRVRKPGFVSNMVASPNVISVGNVWQNPIHVPLTCAPDDVRGAWYTGDTTLQMQLRLGQAAAAQAFSTVNGAVISGGWDVWRESYNAPAPDLPGGWLEPISYYHDVELQVTQQALKNGTTPITLPIDQDYQRIILVFYTGNNSDGTFAPADGLYTSLDLVVNGKIHVIEVASEIERRFEADLVLESSKVLPVGTAVIDMHQLKDVFPTDPGAVQTFVLNIASTSASNNVDVITETVTDNPFAAKWVAQAKANAAPAAA